MQRFYRVYLSISPLGQTELDKALCAIRESWTHPHWIRKLERNQVYLLQVGAEADFCDNLSEEAFAQRLSVAIWKKVGRYVKVVVDAAAEDLPGDCFELNEIDYRKLMRTN
jgi:hypothetical protein